MKRHYAHRNTGLVGLEMLKRYLKDTSGNFAMMFGIGAMILLMGAGAAIDYSSMQSAKTTYQGYADAAVLAAVKSGEETKGKLQKIAQDSVDANNFSGEALNVNLNVSKEGFVRVTVVGNHKTTIMRLFGKSSSNVGAVAESPLASAEPVDIALVLDVTGSMDGAKIESLKTAAASFIDILDDAENENVRVSVIPFAQYVNVGLSRRSEPWLTVPADSSTTGAEKCYMTKDVVSKTNCVTVTKPTKTCYNDGVAYSCGGGSSESCDISYGPEYEECYTPTTDLTWRGCVGSRNTPWNERARKGTTFIPGLMNIYCNQEILALTNDMGVVRNNITSLSASGNTYIPAGLIWGWRTLNYEQPLTEAASNKTKNGSRVLILMTDGANTKSVNGEYHTGSDINDANSVTKNLCLNLKSERIEMYTVAYDFSDPDTLAMLSKCASKKENFFNASDAASLTKAFKDIGASLTDLRLSH